MDNPMNTSLGPFVAASALVALVAGAGTSYASEPRLPEPGVYVGVYGGYNAVLGDWDLAESEDNAVAPDGSLLVGLRLGLQIQRVIAAEIGLALIPFSADSADGLKDLSGIALSWRADAIVSPFDLGAWSPHLLVGLGFYQLASGDLGEDADWDVHWGLGVRWLALDFMNVRAEVRHVISDGFPSGLASNIELHLGVDFWVWDGRERGPKDSDKDGVPDATDLCPTVAGDETAGGCPDRDRDGVADDDDRCPDLPGSKALRGCPDTDGDGLADDRDRCPDVPGVAEYEGCPPPDADGDGVVDAQDRCPNEPGPRHTQGCPDQDGDGVIDALDKCPTQPGVASEAGCLPRAMKRFSGSVQGINFETGSAAIKKGSFRLLDQAVAVFQQYPELRVEIAGHTDDQGDDDDNMRLSEARADAVRAYLIDKGIAPERVMAKGFGETLPVANNKTAAGRAKNRRIEFRIMGAH
jgi:OmpA-OmpF porin, OOP family